jgi:hypothetical protein
MDRQPRNLVGLLTLLTAALGSVAILSSEHHRSALNTAILLVLAVAAAGSLLALVLGSTWLAVARKDVRDWRERHQSGWAVRHYAPDEVSATIQQLRAIRGVDESAITDAGMPCLAVTLEPRTLGDAEDRRLEDAVVTCVVERRSRFVGRAERIEVPIVVSSVWRVRGRWPDVWFDAEPVAPTPGRYRVRWEVRSADGRIERPEQKLNIGPGGEERDSKTAKALRRTQSLIRHFRGDD